ncbi:MAG TPA: D-glycero-beta-D-manno-heptose-7-phosphate kinase [Planctomycetes bacterium]|nr:D-glycero-beta-D-manno-heptose-7-phosphate kinase [Planctomycetota bacterium]
MTSLLQTLEFIDSPRVLVFGDLILDRYVDGNANRVSPEAPVLVFSSGFSYFRLGGAGNVAANVVSAGGEATCLGYVGEDEGAQQMADLLRKNGIDDRGLIVDKSRPTTLKTRFVSKTHQVLRVDEESKEVASREVEDRVLHFLDEHLGGFDALLLSDYGKGVLSLRLLNEVIARAKALDLPVLVDPKGRDFSKYRGATLITPNKKEAEEATGFKIDSATSLEEVADILIETGDLKSVVITLGAEGIFFKTKDGKKRILPTEAKSVFDVTGAGDTVVAILGLGLGAGLDLESSVRLANLAAGIVVGRFGTAAVSREELLGVLGADHGSKILDENSLASTLVKLRSEKKRIVFSNGCFDLLHPGHLDYLAKAKSYGDVLILGVNDDESIRRAKGPTRPICPLKDRLLMLSGLEIVDYLIPFGEDTPLNLIQKISPDVLVKGEDWRDKGVVGRDWVEAHGGQVVLVPFLEGYSTTRLVERIRSQGSQANLGANPGPGSNADK